MFYQLVARHLRTPTGFFGRIVARLMNVGNRPLNLAALDALELADAHHVLEVGFGGASLLPTLLRRTPAGHVTGLELSPTMLERAQRRFREAIERGHLDLVLGTVEAIPLGDGTVDRVLTANTIYFWPDPERAAHELARVLAPEGRLVIGYGRVEDMQRLPPTQYGFQIWEPAEVEALLRRAGFDAIESTESVSPRRSFVLTTGVRPAAAVSDPR